MQTIETLHYELLNVLPPPQATTEMTDQQAQQDAFLAGQIDQPRHGYPFIENTDFDECSRRVDAIGRQLLAAANHGSIPEVYEELVGHKQRELDWLRLCQSIVRQRGQDKQPVDDAAKIDQHTSYLDGEFQRPIFNQFVTEFWDEVRTIDRPRQIHGSVDMIGMSGELEAMLSHIPSVRHALPPANKHVIDLIDFTAQEVFGGQLSQLRNDGPDLDPLALRDVFASLIPHIDLGLSRETPVWTVELDDTRRAIGPEAKTNRLLIPSNRRPQPAKKLGALVAHELWHVVRTMNGELSGEPILKHGTARYMEMEEGSASLMEAAASGQNHIAGKMHYVGIGFLKSGMSVRQAHEALWRYYALTEPDTPSPQTIDEFKQSAYRVLRRAIAGTDQYPRHKDLTYVNGIVKARKVVNDSITQPKELDLLAAGRADQTLANDRTALETLWNQRRI